MKKYLPLAALTLIALFVPTVIENQFVLHSMVMILLYAYLSTSWNIVGGFAGQLSLRHSAFMAIGGYVSTLLTLHLGLSPWLGMLVGAVAAAFVALMIGIPSFRLKGAYYSLATIAFAEALSMLLQPVNRIGDVDLGGAEDLRVIRRIFATDPFRPKRRDEIMPGALYQSDDELVSYLRDNAQSMYHPVGTCRMGSDADAVVDPELRLNGFEGIRVVDASVMPRIPSGNTNAPTIMIAEKASDMIVAER